MKIASWNVNSLNVRLPHLQRWLDEAKPDVVALQETKQEDHKFPEDALLELGYRSVFCGQKTYNGVAIVSRLPFTGECITAIPGFDDPQKRVLAATAERRRNASGPRGDSRRCRRGARSARRHRGSSG